MPAQLPDVLARVNGEAISKAEFERAIQNIEQRAGGPLPAERRDQIVSRACSTSWSASACSSRKPVARKITVPDTDVDARIAEIKKQFPSEEVFTQTLATRKMTLEDLRADQRDELAINRMLADALNEKVTVTPEQIDTFYQQNLERFKQPDQVKASHILICGAAGRRCGDQGRQPGQGRRRPQAGEGRQGLRGAGQGVLAGSRAAPSTAATSATSARARWWARSTRWRSSWRRAR